MNHFGHCFPVDPMLRMHRDLWSVQGQRCYLCGKVFIDGLREDHWLRPTREHVFPRARNAGKRWNILLAHRRCNKQKDDRDPTPCEVLYLEAVNEILEWKRYERARERTCESADMRDVPLVG